MKHVDNNPDRQKSQKRAKSLKQASSQQRPNSQKHASIQDCPNSLPPAKKSLGQHWLTDPAALSAIVAAGQIEATDTVLEIGPGTGTLTQRLVEAAGQVVAVEFDSALAEQLAGRVPAGNLSVVHSDIMQFDLTSLPPGYKVVANIPYYLTSHLIRVLSETVNPPVLAVLLVQKEVAERVAASPGSMSLLSVTAQFYWEVALGQVVAAGSFRPPPAVDSQILVMRRRARPLFELDNRQFFRLVKAGFSNRRKTLQNSLAGGLQINKPTAAAQLTAAGLNPSSRPQELSLDDWRQLYQAIYG